MFPDLLVDMLSDSVFLEIFLKIGKIPLLLRRVLKKLICEVDFPIFSESKVGFLVSESEIGKSDFKVEKHCSPYKL